MPLDESGLLTVFTYCAVIKKGDRRSNYPIFFFELSIIIRKIFYACHRMVCPKRFPL